MARAMHQNVCAWAGGRYASPGWKRGAGEEALPRSGRSAILVGMSAQPLLIVDGEDAPGVVVAGSGQDYGIVTLGNIGEVIDEAGAVADAAQNMSQAELAAAVAKLAIQVRQLAGEVYQLSRGAMHGRVAVTHGDD